MGEEVVKLVAGQDVGARVDHGTPGQILVDGGVLPPVQLVHDHLPDGVRPGGAVLEVAVAAVGHPEVHGVRPERRVLEGGSDGRVVEEGLLLHHGELVVAAHPEVGGPQADDRVVGDVAKLVNDEPGAGHLLGPVVHARLGPKGLVVVVGNGVRGDLVTEPVHLLDCRVVGVLVGHEERGLDVAAVGVPPLLVEDLPVQVNVVVVDGVVKGDGDHLRDPVAPLVLGAQVAGHLRAALGAEAVGQLADVLVAGRGPVGVGVDVCNAKLRHCTHCSIWRILRSKF